MITLEFCPFVVTPVMMMMSGGMAVSNSYCHLRRSWNHHSRKHNKRHYSHQQPCQLSFQSLYLLNTFLYTFAVV
jgi:hypothetical protein